MKDRRLIWFALIEFVKGAKFGDERAQYRIARLLLQGIDGYLETNVERALQYMKLSAKGGFTSAISYLFTIYQKGELGQKKDGKEEIYLWKYKESGLLESC